MPVPGWGETASYFFGSRGGRKGGVKMGMGEERGRYLQRCSFDHRSYKRLQLLVESCPGSRRK